MPYFGVASSTTLQCLVRKILFSCVPFSILCSSILIVESSCYVTYKTVGILFSSAWLYRLIWAELITLCFFLSIYLCLIYFSVKFYDFLYIRFICLLLDLYIGAHIFDMIQWLMASFKIITFTKYLQLVEINEIGLALFIGHLVKPSYIQN